jgi:hypothetical protein
MLMAERRSMAADWRARDERPRDRRAAKQRDELAPFHCVVPPVLAI